METPESYPAYFFLFIVDAYPDIFYNVKQVIDEDPGIPLDYVRKQPL